ncbi:DUF1707 SHOCT-like domain-containing protein [Streptomyces pristinaespiralis]|uniref:DUF1707 SHOCT-like domain-containing protein n=1 Tax=Streptomyces pristinaespiralis TaxID=38300 RepID=UPI00384AFEB8
MASSPDRASHLSEDVRDTAVLRLREAYAEGNFSHGEMDARFHQALTAKTAGELRSARFRSRRRRPCPAGAG